MIRCAIVMTLVAGCSANGDPCAGSKSVCIGLRIEGAVTNLDQLLFRIDTPNTTERKSPDPPKAFNLPVRVALFPPAGTTGTVHVSCDGTGGGALLGHGEVDALLVNNHAERTLTLIALGESDMGMPNLSGVVDGAAGDGPPSSDLANCPTVTACLNGDGCCPSGCNNANDHDCTPVCGNKVVESGEYCDDGNSVNGDGCDPTCEFLGQMSTLSGLAGACGYFEGALSDTTTIRFVGPFGGLASDYGDLDSGMANIFVSDDGTHTIRELPTVGATKTLIGAPFDARLVDGSFTDARIHGDTVNNYPTAMTFVHANQRLYFTDSDGTNRVLREVDFSAQTVTTIPKTQVTGNPIAVANVANQDGLDLFYLAANGDLNKWTIGSPSPTPVASVAQIAVPFGATPPNCRSLGRLFGTPSYLGCTGAIVQVLDGGGVSLLAGDPSNPGCANSTGDLTARFNNVGGFAAGFGAVDVLDCAAIRSVQQRDGGVATVAGQLSTGGFADSDSDPMAALIGNNSGSPFGGTAWGETFGDNGNCAVRYYVNGSPNSIVRTLAGRSPAVHTLAARGTAQLSRYVTQDAVYVGGMVSDGTTLYFSSYANNKGGAAGGTSDTIVEVDLATGSSTDLHSFGSPTVINDLLLFGGHLYVALNDGSIHRIDPSGVNDAVFAGMGGGVTSPPSDGTPGNLLSAVISPRALATDGTDLYFVDTNDLVRKITMATSTLSLVAGGMSGVVDGVADQAGIAFHFNSDLVYAKGALWMLDGGMGPFPNVVRRIDPGTREVKTMAGQVSGAGTSADGLGTGAQISGAGNLATDGQSLFISEAGEFPFEGASYTNGQPVAPVIRQLDLSTFAMTTFLGQRGFTSLVNDTGTKAVIHSPTAIAFDTTKHALYFFDAREGVIQKIR